MIGTTLMNRYTIDALLGQGGTGAVYLAHDTVLERKVAVKLLTELADDADRYERFLAEARATAKLNHPNIVTVYDVGRHQPEGAGTPTPFMAMEYVEGKTLLRRQPETIEETMAIARQLCLALEHAHGAGIVHRDIKRENVIIAADGTAKLMDFGMARSLATRVTEEGVLAGTVFYMAPELALGKEYDGRADLYALGVLLYELTTGELPFTGSDPVAVISQHLHAPVVPPRAHNETIPLGLDRLIVKLLGKSPDDRPRSARSTLELLNKVDTTSTGSEEIGALSLLDRINRGRLIGREAQLKEARELWTRAAAGNGQTLLVSGEPGIGKTRLTMELATLAELTGGQVLTGECFSEGGAPYYPFAQIVRQVLREEAAVQPEIPSHVLADVLKLTPQLLPLYPDVTPNPPLNAAAEEQRFIENTVEFFSHLCRTRPLMLVLEDAHWADSATLGLVKRMARRLQQQNILIVATYREVEIDEASPLRQFNLDLNRSRLATRIKLSRLDKKETLRLLESIFSDDITSDFLEAIFLETEGNPFFVEEVCKSLIDNGNLTFENGHWIRDEMVPLDIPQSLKSVVGSRISQLSAKTRKVLTTASVIGREFEFDLLQQVSDYDEDLLLDLIDEALAAQVIAENRKEGQYIYRFQHALIGNTLYESMNRRRQAINHRRIGERLEQMHSDNLEKEAGRLAYHFSRSHEAADFERALKYHGMAADHAKTLFAYHDSIFHCKEAIDLLEGSDRIEEQILLWEKLGLIHRQTNERQGMVDSFDRAIVLWKSLPDGDRETGIRLYSRIGEVARWGAYHPRSAEYIVAGLELLGDEPSLLRVRLYTSLSFVKYWIGGEINADYPGALKAGLMALELAEQLENPSAISGALDALNGLHHVVDDPESGEQYVQRRQEMYDQLSELEQLDLAHMAGLQMQIRGKYAEAVREQQIQYDFGIAKGVFAFQFNALWAQVGAHLSWERWAEALAGIEEFVELSAKTDGRHWSSSVSVPTLARVGAALAQILGEEERAVRLLEKGAEVNTPAEQKRQSMRVSNELIWLSDLFMVLGQPNRAADALSESQQGLTTPQLATMRAVASAAIAVALRQPDALEQSQELYDQVKDHYNRRHRAVARYSLGQAHYNAGDHDKAEWLLEEALEIFRELDTNWHQGRTLSLLAEISLARGDKAGAAHLLKEAQAGLEKIGMDSMSSAMRQQLATLS